MKLFTKKYLMKKIIIAAVTTYNPSLGGTLGKPVEWEINIKKFTKEWKDKSTAVAFSLLSAAGHFMKEMNLEDRLSQGGDLYGYEMKVFSMIDDIETADIRQMQSYTQMMYDTTGSWKVIDLTENSVNAFKFTLESIKEQSHLSQSFYREVSQYVQLFERARYIYDEMQKGGIEVVITDFVTAHCLHILRPDEFDIFNDVPSGYPVESGIVYVRRQFENYQIFNAWKLENAIPFLTGTWDVQNPQNGRFQMYAVGSLGRGRIKGIVHDKHGLAVFAGRLGKTQIHFVTRYLAGAIKAATGPFAINDSPTWYGFDFDTKDGYYSPKTKKGSKKEYFKAKLLGKINSVLLEK